MRSLLAASLLATTLSGCSALGGDDQEGTQVVASFYPLAWVAERVSGRDVELLTTPGAEPHDFELTIKETALVAQADLVLYEHGFQPAVDAAVDENAEGRVVDAAESVDLMAVDEEAAEHAEEGGDDHEHGEEDPHFWLDPMLMADLGDVVAEELAEVDPDQADAYLANADELRADLEELEAAYDEGLRGCERDTVVVSHDAFGYLERFGLTMEPIAGLSPSAEPSPADLARLQDLIRSEGITTVFAETLGSTKMADSLASDLGLRTLTLDPVEGVDPDSGDDYLTLMRRNLDNLRTANGC